MWRFILSALLIFGGGATVKGDDLVVETDKGKVKGVQLDSGHGKKVRAWLGVPFAEPPLGDKRFKKPEPKSKWSETKETTKQPNSCMQTIDTTYPDFPGATMWNANTNISEDCLYLNVIAPDPMPTKAAVLVWIFGGGFYCGSATLDVYDPKIFVSEENVVVVSIQHRLASLGFLYLNDPSIDANVGLYDQRMAFQWVQDNIEKFGGDKNRVTVFGMSSGSSSTALHLMAPDSYKLFNNAILESGTAFSPWTLMSKEKNRERALALGKKMKCTGDDKAVAECLRNVQNSTELVYSEWSEEAVNHLGAYEFPFVPVVDKFFGDSVENEKLPTTFKQSSLLLGSNREEGFYFLFYFLDQVLKKQENTTIDETQYKDAVTKTFAYLPDDKRNLVLENYIKWLDASDPHKYRDSLDKMVGDAKMTCSVKKFADMYAAGNQNVYQYVFDRISNVSPWPTWSKAMHGEEVYYIFGEPLSTSKNYSEDDKKLCRNMMKYWANFAKSGDPNQDDKGTTTATTWPKYDTTDMKHLVLAPELKVGTKHREEQCKFWSTLEEK